MTYALCTKNQRCGKLEGHECGCSGETEPPTAPTTAEAFAAIRELLSILLVERLEGVGKFYAARDALALLERRMHGSPPLATLVEGFCQEVERAKYSRDARKGGGQITGAVSPFEHVQPSVASNLDRWARDFREALKR